MTLHPFLEQLSGVDPVARTGRVRKILPTYLEADGPSLPLGALTEVETPSGTPLLAEVVGVRADAVVLAPLEDFSAVAFGAKVQGAARADLVPVGDQFLGRAVDALGRPIDGRATPVADGWAPLETAGGTPLDKISPKKPLETGVRAIDGLLTLGRGQRIGVFAPSGGGKTTLLWQLVRQVEADRIVICLVGERGREVEALWERGLPADAKARSVLVAATSDQSAAMRVRSCRFALALADRWRSEGLQVLFLLDSVTRMAMALREVGLAAGEPPTVRAYTPGVFAAIPKLVERCGALRGGGSITAIMAVLSETDDVDDPVCEMMKSLLDGHIILSRDLASQGHFPAIDVPRSISRLAGDVVEPSYRNDAEAAVSALSTYDASKVLVESGIYVAGGNPALDRSIAVRPELMRFLKQRQDERVPFAACRQALGAILRKGDEHARNG